MMLVVVFGAGTWGYHPNDPSTPYWFAAISIGFVSATSTALLALTLSTPFIANRLSKNRRQTVVLGFYATLAIAVLAIWGNAALAPKSVIQ